MVLAVLSIMSLMLINLSAVPRVCSQFEAFLRRSKGQVKSAIKKRLHLKNSKPIQQEHTSQELCLAEESLASGLT